jgi:hypothetical protein
MQQNREEVIGKSFFDVFPFATEKDRDMFAGFMNKCLGGVSHRISDYTYMRDQDTLFINISINPLVLHGEVSGIILSSSDVTEEIKLKEVLRDYAARLEELVKERTDELIEKETNADCPDGWRRALSVDDQNRIVINKTLRQWIGEEEGQITLDDIYGGNVLQNAIIDNKIVQEAIL